MTKNNSAFTPLQLGIGTGTVLLLSKWVASISTLALPESIINYGLIAGILYAMIGPFTLILLGILIKKYVLHSQKENPFTITYLINFLTKDI